MVGPMGGMLVVNCWGWPKVLALAWEMGGFGRLGWRATMTIVKGVNNEVFWAKGVWDGVVWTNGGVVVARLACGMEISS